MISILINVLIPIITHNQTWTGNEAFPLLLVATINWCFCPKYMISWKLLRSTWHLFFSTLLSIERKLWSKFTNTYRRLEVIICKMIHTVRNMTLYGRNVYQFAPMFCFEVYFWDPSWNPIYIWPRSDLQNLLYYYIFNGIKLKQRTIWSIYMKIILFFKFTEKVWANSQRIVVLFIQKIRFKVWDPE